MTVLAHTAAGAGMLESARLGDEGAFASIVDDHGAMVFSIAFHMLGNRHAAEELAQDVFLQLFRSISQIESESHLVFWLRQVSSRRAIDQIRRSRWKLVPLDVAETVAREDQPRDPWLARRVLANLGDLPDLQRAVVTLRYQEDLDPMEIASILNLPVNTVKSHLHRALRALRKRLETEA
jgi:RNA polymerase sigma-70 factor, ECF subfamily